MAGACATGASQLPAATASGSFGTCRRGRVGVAPPPPAQPRIWIVPNFFQGACELVHALHSRRSLRLRRWSAATILVNNAGVAWQGTLDTYDREHVARMRQVNVEGMIHATRAVMGGMRARRYGRIVNMSSVAARAVTSGSRSDLSTECVSCFTLGPADTFYRREITEQSVMVVGLLPSPYWAFPPSTWPRWLPPAGSFSILRPCHSESAR
jgi:NAD(P)-dependent dehydrogenase (short-subunit alcohol dehydrogenase family)